MPRLPDALARTALSIVESPEEIVRFSLKNLGWLCRAGEAGIVRLCRMYGWRLFREGADVVNEKWDQTAPFRSAPD